MGKVSDALLDEEELFEEKNEWLGSRFEELEPMEFYRELFPRGSFERKGVYEDRKGNGILIRVDSFAGEHEQRVFRSTITDELGAIKDAIENHADDFCIISPVSYSGIHRTADNARYLYALTFDIDGVTDIQCLSSMFHQFKHRVNPCPTFIVNSGHGVHLYYQFENPIPMYPGYQEGLYTLKKYMTTRLWNPYTSTDKDVQLQSIVQGFRVPGTNSKNGLTTRVFRCGDPVRLQDLFDFFPPGTFSIGNIDECRKMTLLEAKEKYPEWYQKRVIEKQPLNRWKVKRDLYDWWKKKILTDITLHHRYFSLMTLAIYGKKCQIPFEEVEEDAYSFVEHLDSLTDDLSNPFTQADVESALRAYHDRYTTFPRKTIEELTAVSMPANRRNNQSQADHLEEARVIRDIRMRRQGRKWDDNNGRPSKQLLVQEWRAAHPDGTKYACIKETGLSKPTVYKWWNCEGFNDN